MGWIGTLLDVDHGLMVQLCCTLTIPFDLTAYQAKSFVAVPCFGGSCGGDGCGGRVVVMAKSTTCKVSFTMAPQALRNMHVPCLLHAALGLS